MERDKDLSDNRVIIDWNGEKRKKRKACRKKTVVV